MITKHSRFPWAVLLVLASLAFASMACYSDQVPGLFELTPYHTPTPIPPADEARFAVLDTVLAPDEEGRAFFNMTEFPEPLEDSLVNSRGVCDGPAPATVLYSGMANDGNVYYLINCTGAIGWAVEERLAGPLKFRSTDLAITLLREGERSVLMLDDNLNPMPLSFCQPESIVPVRNIQPADPDGDGIKDIYYQIECPVGTRGWVTNQDLVGPVQMQSDARAIALANADGAFLLTTEPAPPTSDNLVDAECEPGATVESSAAQLIGDTVYFNVTCGEAEGWAAQETLVGPLRFEVGEQVVIFVPPQFVFADTLVAEDIGGEVADVADVADEDAGADDAAADDAAAEDTAADTAADPADPEAQRDVVEITLPLYLTGSPAEPIVTGDDANVVGQCATNTVALINDYAGIETDSVRTIYYNISCEACAESETAEDGTTTCTRYETVEGWTKQFYLQGPIEFAPGQVVAFKSSSAVRGTDEETGVEYNRVPANLTGALSIGSNTEFAGRCPLDSEVTVLGVVLEQARTSASFSFYYEISCQGQVATYVDVREERTVRRVVQYADEADSEVTGFVQGRELTEPEDE